MRTAPVRHIYGYVQRRSDPQWMVRRGRFVQFDPYRNPLNDLDPVAGGILRRNEGKSGAGPCADSGHLPCVCVSGIDIGRYRGGLPDAHVGELSFLEICFNVNLAQRDNGHQGLSGLNPVAHLNILLGNVAFNRRRNHAVGQVQPGRLKLGHRFVTFSSESLDFVELDIDVGPLASCGLKLSPGSSHLLRGGRKSRFQGGYLGIYGS